MIGAMELLLIAAAAAVLAVVVFVAVIARKGRPFAPGDVFRASRWTRGNRWFPTQVQVSPTAVALYTPQWVGRREESIHIAHVASVRIDTHLIFSDVFIETSGGVSPISCYGHYKKDAVRIKQLIDQYESEYFKTPAPAAPPGTPLARPVR
jgi:hypothetical protein